MPTNKPGYYKKYYNENYDKILGNLMRKVVCPCCDKEFPFTNMSRHKKTKKHLKNEIKKKSEPHKIEVLSSN